MKLKAQKSKKNTSAGGSKNRSRSSGSRAETVKEQRQYYNEGRHYTYQPTPDQLRAMRENISKARQVWMNMPPEERHENQPNTPAQQEARRQNIKKARLTWMRMAPEERSKRMPGGGNYEPGIRRRSGTR